MAASPHRQKPWTVRFLKWRIRFFGIGAVLGLAGIFLDASWLVTVALVVLLSGVGLRHMLGAGSPDEEDEPEDDAQA